VILAGVGFQAVRRRVDVFPLALVAASIIALVTTLIAEIRWRGLSASIGLPLLLALWLIISSTASGRVLMHLLRRWRADREPA
jgi:hypothetical protein